MFWDAEARDASCPLNTVEVKLRPVHQNSKTHLVNPDAPVAKLRPALATMQWNNNVVLQDRQGWFQGEGRTRIPLQMYLLCIVHKLNFDDLTLVSGSWQTLWWILMINSLLNIEFTLLFWVFAPVCVVFYESSWSFEGKKPVLFTSILLAKQPSKSSH